MGRIADLQQIEVDKLIPYAKNAKKHGAEQIEKLCRSIQEFGFLTPCLIDAEHNLIAGHGRVMAAKKLGLETVPCVYIEGLTEAQRRAYILADNRLTELGDWDMELVQSELKELADADFDVSLTGFDSDVRFDDEMAAISEDGWGAENETEAEPRAKRGEIYQLGEHRLMCGDSTDPEDVAALMDGATADLLLTDPPYNVALGNNGGNENDNKHKRQDDGVFLLNDNLDDASFTAFLTQAFINATHVLKDGGTYYIWHAASSVFNFLAACKNAEMQMRQILIWRKNTFTIGRQDYQWQYEPCIYGWKAGAGHYFLNSRKQSTVLDSPPLDLASMTAEDLRALVTQIFTETATDVIDEDRPTRSDLHPTMKPLRLMAYLIRNSSRPGEIVLDLFGGSGSTMMAAEQMDRRCFMMEYDPHYVDVIIDRYKEMTGTEAICINASKKSGGGR